MNSHQQTSRVSQDQESGHSGRHSTDWLGQNTPSGTDWIIMFILGSTDHSAGFSGCGLLSYKVACCLVHCIKVILEASVPLQTDEYKYKGTTSGVKFLESMVVRSNVIQRIVLCHSVVQTRKSLSS